MGGARTLGRSRSHPLADPQFRLALWLLLAGVGWIGILTLGAQLYAMRPPHAGFDLELLLSAGRRVATGFSPYGSLPSVSTQAEDLFYSYPPPVAQVFALLASLPSWLVLLVWGAGAIVGLALITGRIADRFSTNGHAGIEPAIAVLAVSPYLLPFTVAILFGNLDAWFPLLYGMLLLAVLEEWSPMPSVAARILGGIALGLASVAKLHPASLFVWLAVRALRSRTHRLTLGAALGTVAIVAVASLVVGGTGPWEQYLDLVRAGAQADLVTWLNIGPASQLALLVGNAGLARPLAIVVAILALVVTVWSAATRSDPVESLAWAAVASLVILPVTWYHYPVVLLPFAAAAWARRRPRDTTPAVLLGAAGAVATVAILLPVVAWLAVALVLAGIARSQPNATTRSERAAA